MFLDLSNVKTDEAAARKMPKAGKYLVRCVEAEVKTTAAKTGQFINCKFRFVDEEHKDTWFFHTFNFKNSSAKAQEIGLKQIKALLEASGKDSGGLEHVTDLVGLIALAQIGIETYEGKDRIKVKYFTSPEDNKPVGGEALFS